MPASRERVLVVDDSPAQRHYVADCLARQGFDVVTAEDGQVGFEQGAREPPALIVCRLRHAGDDRLRAGPCAAPRPETRDIPVIMLTARDTRRDMAQMRAAGATAYLVKPFAQDKCIAIVERTLAERRLTRYKEASRAVHLRGRACEPPRSARAAASSTRPRRRAGDAALLFSRHLAASPRCRAKLHPRELIAAAQRLLRRDVPDDQRARRRHRQVHRRRDHGGLRGRARRSTPHAAARGARRAGDAGRRWRASTRGAAPAQLAMRIGINTGPVVRGDLGLALRAPRLHGDRRHREPRQRYEAKRRSAACC